MTSTELTAAAKATAAAWVADHLPKLSAWHSTIWEYAEPAWREYRSAEWYVAKLKAEGFTVETGSGGMPPSFRGSGARRVHRTTPSGDGSPDATPSVKGSAVAR